MEGQYGMEAGPPLEDQLVQALLLYNKCMEGQYGKGNLLTLDLYKSCPTLKAPFAKYCKVF